MRIKEVPQIRLRKARVRKCCTLEGVTSAVGCIVGIGCIQVGKDSIEIPNSLGKTIITAAEFLKHKVACLSPESG